MDTMTTPEQVIVAFQVVLPDAGMKVYETIRVPASALGDALATEALRLSIEQRVASRFDVVAVYGTPAMER
jgi:hypothetical protein